MSDKYPITRAVHVLREHQVPFEAFLFRYEGRGDVARDAARALGLPEEQVFKTLVFLANGEPIVVLAAANQRVSTRKLGRACGADVTECDPRDAERHTGYKVGGISPLGTKRTMPVFVDETVVLLEHLYVNGGSHGFLVKVTPDDLIRLLCAKVGDWAVER
jgi:Cys-tRNA(Pro) deacylase